MVPLVRLSFEPGDLRAAAVHCIKGSKDKRLANFALLRDNTQIGWSKYAARPAVRIRPQHQLWRPSRDGNSHQWGRRQLTVFSFPAIRVEEPRAIRTYGRAPDMLRPHHQRFFRIGVDTLPEEPHATVAKSERPAHCCRVSRFRQR